MSGFQFMPHIFDMITASPSANMNLDYNMWNSQLNRDSIMYMNPGFNASVCMDYPIFNAFGDNLLNPNLAIGQVMNSFGNCKFNNNGWNFGDMFKFNNGFNLNNTSPFSPSTPSNNNGASAADQVKQAEYDKLKKILTAYRDNNSLSDSMNAKINEALNKSGKIEEKLDALKAAIKTLDDKKLQKVILSDQNVLGKLDSCGYNTSKDKLKNDNSDTELKNKLTKIKQDLEKNPAKFDNISVLMAQSAYDNILRTISFWNDENNNIIKCISEVIPTNDKELTLAKGAVENIVNSLLNKSTSIQEKYTSSSDFTKLKAAHKEVEEAYKKVQKDFSKGNLQELAGKFDKLYAILRLTDASAVGAQIKNDYQKVLKDATGKDIIPDDFVVAETKEDLKAEGIQSIPEVDPIEEAEPAEEADVSDIDSLETPEEKIKALKSDESGKVIIDSPAKDVYMTNASCSTEKPHFYVIKDDKIQELKDVVAINAQGECTMKDGSKKPLKDAKKSTDDVKAEDIKNYTNTLKRVEKLVNGDDKRLIECKTKLDNNTLYKSIGNQESERPQYFIVRGNELKQIDCDYVDNKGKIHCPNNVILEPTALSDDYLKPIKDEDILKTDKVSSDIEDLISNGILKESYCKKPKVYYSSGSGMNKHYILEKGTLKELIGVTKIDAKGDVTLLNGEKTRYDNSNKVKQKTVKAKDLQDFQDIVKPLLNNGSLRTTNCKNPMVYYSESTAKHYILENGMLCHLQHVKHVYGSGVVETTNGTRYNITDKKIPHIEVKDTKEEFKMEDPSISGKLVGDKLRAKTKEDDYEYINKKMMEFQTYTNVDDIVKFITAANEATNRSLVWNSTFCSQISSEEELEKGIEKGDGLSAKRKNTYLRIIAKQMMKVMIAAGYKETDKDYIAMKYIAEQAGKNGNGWDINGSWSLFYSDRTGAANEMDNIIKDVLEKYNGKQNEK